MTGVAYCFLSSQDLPVGGVVTKDVEARDADAGINALVEYRVIPASSSSSVTGDQEANSTRTEDGYG